MQDASAEFEAAVAAHRTWVPPRLRTDWDRTGYGGDGTIDDLSPQMSDAWEVDHTLDDGYPDVVAFVSGTSVPELTAELSGRVLPLPAAPMTAPAYWSPMRTDSPVYGYDRDVAPVTLDVGLITEAGQEYARVFTGQMANVPVQGGVAKLQTISAARLKLMKLVQAPAFAAIYAGGLHATWPVSYCLTQCGIYAGPRPRTGTAWYAPMHGSAWAMIPSGNTAYSYAEAQSGSSFPNWTVYEETPGALLNFPAEVDWIRGPYVSAPDLQLTASMRRAMYTSELRLDQEVDSAMSFEQNAGRLEMWVRGDATDVNNAPGGSASVSRMCSFWMAVDTPTVPYVQMGITPTRYLQIQVWDGTVARTLTSATTLPTDGEWHFMGVAYDMTADRLWMNFDGTLSSSTQSMTVANLPADDAWLDGYPVFLSNLPVAEITFTTGAEANVDNYPLWRDDESFAPTATLEPSAVKLVALAETEPREAWQTITDYAKAELASVRLTETDLFQYLPLSWWVRDPQQVVVDAFDTEVNAGKFDIDADPTKIRNTVKVSYTALDVVEFNAYEGGFQPIYELDDNGLAIPIVPGVSAFRFTYSGVGILPLQRVEVASDTFPPIIGDTYVMLNDVPDGSGVYASDEEVHVSFDAWDAGSATLRFTNMTTLTWYLASSFDEPPLRIVGLPIEETSTYVIDRDATSIEARNERALEVSAPAIQTEVAARRLARNLKMSLRKAVVTIGSDQQGVDTIANPLRQPGDLVTFRDQETGVADGQWRLRGVHHKGKGADYTQSVVARRALPIMIIGEGRIGETLIGPASE